MCRHTGPPHETTVKSAERLVSQHQAIGRRPHRDRQRTGYFPWNTQLFSMELVGCHQTTFCFSESPHHPPSSCLLFYRYSIPSFVAAKARFRGSRAQQSDALLRLVHKVSPTSSCDASLLRRCRRYPNLFCKGKHDSITADAIVADTFSYRGDPQVGDPGAIVYNSKKDALCPRR